MTVTGDRLARLLALVPWLLRHPGVAMQTAADAFGVTLDQLRDDVDLVFCCGLPGYGPGELVDFAFAGDTITVVEPQTLRRPLRLTADEATWLLAAARGLSDVAGLREQEPLRRAIAKLDAAGSGLDSPEPGADPAGVPPPLAVDVAPGDVDPETLTVVQRAVAQRRRLRMSYLVAARDELTQRDVDPVRLVLRDGWSYLEGWCHKAEGIRLFRLDRVRSLELLDISAEVPAEAVDQPQTPGCDAGVFRSSPDDPTAVLELDAVGRWVAEYYPCEQVQELPGGGVRATLRTPDLARLLPLLLSLAGHGRVVAPVELVVRVREAAAEALRRYASPDLAPGGAD